MKICCRPGINEIFLGYLSSLQKSLRCNDMFVVKIKNVFLAKRKEKEDRRDIFIQFDIAE